MSTIIMSSCWPLQNMSPAQKAVLISLADNANDEGVCWPSIAKISERTCLSERAVRNALRWLEESGVLTCHQRTGRSTYYTLTPAAYAPGSICPPAPDAAPPRHQMPDTPAPDAPRTVIEPSIEPTTKSRASKGTRLPTDWSLPEEWMEWALNERPDWGDVDVLKVAETFKDFWIAKTGSSATKMDWLATWRNWVRNEKRGHFKPSSSKPQSRHHGLDNLDYGSGAKGTVVIGGF